MLPLLGFVSMAISWVAGAYLLSRWRLGRSMTISKHATEAKAAYIIFAGTLVVGGTLFYYFMRAWFIPTFHLSPLFAQIITVTYIAQVVTGLVPDTKGWQNRLHVVAAYTLATTFLPLSVLVLSSPYISTGAQIIGSLCFVYIVCSFILVVVFRRAKGNYLPLQALYILAFQFLVIAATFIR